MSLLRLLMASSVGSHRYWRINITATDTGATATSLAELEFRATVGGATLCTGGTASASSTFDASHTAIEGFDGNGNTTWSSVSSGLPAWLRYVLPSASSVNQVAIRARNEGGSTFGQTPKDFSIQSSDDGTTWTTEWSVTGQTGWTINEVRTFNRP